jgi:sugar phosphate permease
MAFVVFAIATLALVLLRNSPTDLGLPSIQAHEDKPEQNDVPYEKTLVPIVKDPAMWVLSLVLSAYMVATRLVPGWLPLYATHFYVQEYGLGVGAAVIAAGGTAATYTLGRVFASPLAGWLSDALLARGYPRSCVIGGGLVLVGVIFLLFTLHIPNTVALALLSFCAGAVINIFPLIGAAAAEIWSVRSAGFSMGVLNMVGQFAGATALGASGFVAAMLPARGDAFWTEFVGIWYLGVMTSLAGALTSLYVIVRERRMIIAKAAQRLPEDRTTGPGVQRRVSDDRYGR